MNRLISTVQGSLNGLKHKLDKCEVLINELRF